MNIKFAYTVSSTKFLQEISRILENQKGDLDFADDLYAISENLKYKDFDMFFSEVKELRNRIQYFQLLLDDIETNVQSYIDQVLTMKAPEELPLKPEEPFSSTDSTNDQDQLTKLNDLMNKLSTLQQLKNELDNKKEEI